LFNFQYDFDVRRIRDPVKQLVEANGWKFKQIVLDYKHPSRRDQNFCGQCGASLAAGAAFCMNCGKRIP